MSIKAKDLIPILARVVPKAAETPLRSQTNLFRLGLLDSFSLVQFIMAVEEAYSISIDVTDMRLKNFRSLRRFAALINKKLALGR
jgi:acyl carrier protein